jgi:hypothetical protein
MSFQVSQIPILDLSENKIIKEFPKPIGLASNLEEENAIKLDSNKLAALSTEHGLKSVPSINLDQTINKNKIKGKKIHNNILKQEKTVEYKPYNLTDLRHGQYVIQSREDYRRNNLRPNGRRYD